MRMTFVLILELERWLSELSLFILQISAAGLAVLANPEKYGSIALRIKA